MHALVLCDDYWHPAEVPRAGLAPLAEQGMRFDWLEDAAEWSAARMAAYPLVVLAKANHATATDRTNWMTAPVEAAFAEYVRQGHGLLAIHSGTAGYQAAPGLRQLLGGVFTHHPEQCPVTVVPAADHPLGEGSAPFTVQDEHYFMALDDPHVEVYAITRSAHGDQPGAWRRSHGAGRVAVLTPGHNLPVWLHPGFQALLRNTVRWCGGA